MYYLHIRHSQRRQLHRKTNGADASRKGSHRKKGSSKRYPKKEADAAWLRAAKARYPKWGFRRPPSRTLSPGRLDNRLGTSHVHRTNRIISTATKSQITSIQKSNGV